MNAPILLIMVGVIMGLLLALVFGRGTPGLPGCGCVTNVVMGLLLIAAGLILLIVAGIIPKSVICERVSNVFFCFD